MYSFSYKPSKKCRGYLSIRLNLIKIKNADRHRIGGESLSIRGDYGRVLYNTANPYNYPPLKGAILRAPYINTKDKIIIIKKTTF